MTEEKLSYFADPKWQFILVWNGTTRILCTCMLFHWLGDIPICEEYERTQRKVTHRKASLQKWIQIFHVHYSNLKCRHIINDCIRILPVRSIQGSIYFSTISDQGIFWHIPWYFMTKKKGFRKNCKNVLKWPLYDIQLMGDPIKDDTLSLPITITESWNCEILKTLGFEAARVCFLGKQTFFCLDHFGGKQQWKYFGLLIYWSVTLWKSPADI